MFIEDIELRNIYKTASEEHVQNLEYGLLHLEKYPSDTARLEELLREAHTLKGDSRMLGVNDVETLTHQIEDTLVAVKHGETTLSSQTCDRLYQGVDAIRRLIHEAVTGQPAGINVLSVLAQLTGEEVEEDEKYIFSNLVKADTNTSDIAVELDLFNDTFLDTVTEKLEPSINNKELLPSSPSPSACPCSLPPSPPASSIEVSTAQISNYHIDTIRVEPQKLDTLMTQAGELTVTKIRIAHRMSEIEEIVTLWEEWSRDIVVNSQATVNLQRDFLHGSQQVQNFHARVEQRLERLGTLVNKLKNAASEDIARLDVVVNELESGIRTLRLLPLSTVFNLFPRMVRDLAKQQSKEVNLVIEGGETRADKRILEEMKDPLMHMLRNSIDHGIETPQEREELGKPRAATIRLNSYQNASSIVIEIVDDGRGINIEKIKQTALQRGVCSEAELAVMTNAQIQSLIFSPGFSTQTKITELSGRGVGLDVVRANVERLKGSIHVDSTFGMGCTFKLKFNTTLATTHVLIVEVNQVFYALPMEFVQTTLLVPQQNICSVEGCPTMLFDDQAVSVARLADLLELSIPSQETAEAAKLLTCIIIQSGTERLGLFVDALVDEQEIVFKAQSKLLKRIRNISGATILGTGEVCMVLNSQDLLKSVRKRTISVANQELVETWQETSKKQILFVEDSLTIRTQVKRILESAGYEVVVAVDGLDGLNKLQKHTFDAVVTDVQMPNLDGFSLTTKIRQHQEYSELPIVLCTTLASDEDRKRGAEAGANAYLTKGNFEQKLLLDTLKRLV